ncbi:SprT-like domain-containing protein [Phycisphaerales bacterium AB-hyl4]|uniref:SprT-like domain-containing protein n=1 Tax=Natronomicrosphaera hydrolytica TaxID=3242702 RepID=A0ABV4U5M1_9BACT
MHLHDAERLALTLMNEHGLIEKGWRFRWSRGKRQLGLAQIRRRPDRHTGQVGVVRTIRLSQHLVQLNGEAEVRDTILHEIAHALAGLEHGHDAHWQAVCRRVGAKPQRLADATVRTPIARYQVVCGRCRRVLATRHRRASRRWLQRAYCRHCGPETISRLNICDVATVQPHAPLRSSPSMPIPTSAPTSQV